MSDLIASVLEPDGVLLATLDMPGRTMNVFSPALIEALQGLMDRVDRDPAVRAVVLTSGKGSFLAGADLEMVRDFCLAARHSTPAQMFALCGRLGRLFLRLEASDKPWVAAVNGLALGGGLELALACRHRLVAEGPRIQLGVPEIKLGLLPGAGGTQRLPRLAGYAAGLELLLSGRSMAPDEAVRLGVFEQAVPADRLLDEARRVARAQAGQPYVAARKFAHLAQPDVPPHADGAAHGEALRAGIDAGTLAHYPAYDAIAEAVLQGARRPMAEANTIEMQQFLRLMFDPVAGRMVRTLFLERQRAERESAATAVGLGTVALGPLSAACSAWRQATARLPRDPMPAPTLPEDTMSVTGADGRACTIRLATLATPVTAGAAETVAVLSPPGAWGRVIEVLGADHSVRPLLAAVTARIGILPWWSGSPRSVLGSLLDQPIAVQASLALQHLAEHPSCDPLLLDVAACLSGVAPGWTGGPLAWLWDEQQRAMDGTAPPAGDAWQRCRPRLEQAYAAGSGDPS